MHVAAFIGELQHYKNFKPSYLSIGKWAISPFLSDQITYTVAIHFTVMLVLIFSFLNCQLISYMSSYKQLRVSSINNCLFLNEVADSITGCTPHAI